MAFGVKGASRSEQQVESTDRIVGRAITCGWFRPPLGMNPSGLLVADFSEQQMVGERDGDLLQQSQIREK
jgi:hypothetical protein